MKRGKPTDTPGISVVPGGFAIRVVVKLGSVKIEKAKTLRPGTRAEAESCRERMLEEARAEAQQRAEGIEPDTVGALALRWLEVLGGRMAADTMTPTTVETHRGNVERFVIPFFGRMRFADLGPYTFHEFFAWLEQQKTSAVRRGRGKKEWAMEPRPYSRDTLHGAWRTARRFVRWAALEERAPSPEYGVRFEVATPKSPPKASLTGDEQAAFAVELRHDPRLHAMLVVEVVGGLRFCEVSGLHVDDFAADLATYEVRRSVVKGHVGRTKTVSSRRVVVMTPEAASVLRAYLESVPHPAPRILFAGSTGNYPTLSGYNRALKAAAERAGIAKRVSSHVLRKTANNLLRRAAGSGQAMATLGHVTEQSHERYSDYEIGERLAAALAAFGGRLGGAGPTPEA